MEYFAECQGADYTHRIARGDAATVARAIACFRRDPDRAVRIYRGEPGEAEVVDELVRITAGLVRTTRGRALVAAGADPEWTATLDAALAAAVPATREAA